MLLRAVNFPRTARRYHRRGGERQRDGEKNEGGEREKEEKKKIRDIRGNEKPTGSRQRVLYALLRTIYIFYISRKAKIFPFWCSLLFDFFFARWPAAINSGAYGSLSLSLLLWHQINSY